MAKRKESLSEKLGEQISSNLELDQSPEDLVEVLASVEDLICVKDSGLYTKMLNCFIHFSKTNEAEDDLEAMKTNCENKISAVNEVFLLVGEFLKIAVNEAGTLQHLDSNGENWNIGSVDEASIELSLDKVKWATEYQNCIERLSLGEQPWMKITGEEIDFESQEKALLALKNLTSSLDKLRRSEALKLPILEAGIVQKKVFQELGSEN